MKKTQLLDARRNIRKEIIAFSSIAIIGMLASLAYLGIAYAAAALKKDALSFFNNYGLWDFQVTATLLMDEEDLDAIRALPGVSEAEPVWLLDTKLYADDSITDVEVISRTENISVPALREGRLPEAAGECAVEKELADICGLAVGRTIRLDNRAITNVDLLLDTEFVITGIFQSPDHISFMIPVTPYVLVTPDSFNREGLDGAFMQTLIRADDTPSDRYSEAYQDKTAPLEEALQTLASERAPLRHDKLYDRYNEQILDGQRQLDEAAEQLREGQRQLDEAAEQLRQGREKIEDGRRELAAAAEKLALAKNVIDYSENQLVQWLRWIEEGAEVVADRERLVQRVNALVARYGIDGFVQNLSEEDWPLELGVSLDEFKSRLSEEGREQAIDWLYEASGYNAGVAILNALIDYYDTGRDNWYYLGEQYLDGLTQYRKGSKQLEDGERDLEEGQAQYEDGRRKLEEAQQQYEDGQRQLDEAREKLDLIGECEWVVLNDRSNPGFIYAHSNSTKLSSLSMSFSSIFLIVGALVIYATVSRMVEQQRVLVGAAKAMGLYNREILAKYLIFACGAVVLGVGFGILIAWLPVQRLILRSYEAYLCYGRGTDSFLPLQTGLVAAGALAISIFAVWLGCSQLLRLPAIRLMQGAAPASGRKKARSSSSRSLYSRLILLNMRTDWRRVLVTVVSIAGGCVLMVVGFTLRYGISAVPDRQFSRIQTFEAEIKYDSDLNPSAAAEIDAFLDRKALPHVNLTEQAVVFEYDGTLNAVTLIIADEGTLETYFYLQSVSDGGKLALPDSGVLVPRRFWEYYGLGPGDTVPVYDAGKNYRQIPISGVFENYFGQFFFLTPQGYEEFFGAPPERNFFFAKLQTDDMTLDQLALQLGDVNGVLNVAAADANRTLIEQFTESLKFVVWMMLFLAAMMACFIVANFTMTYIQRKTRELTIMRINGFNVWECIRYAAVDLVITTLLGTFLGLLAGRFLGDAVLRTTETPYIQMIREPQLQTYLYAALVTCGFSLVTNCFALRRIKYLKLTDINT